MQSIKEQLMEESEEARKLLFVSRWLIQAASTSRASAKEILAQDDDERALLDDKNVYSMAVDIKDAKGWNLEDLLMARELTFVLGTSPAVPSAFSHLKELLPSLNVAATAAEQIGSEGEEEEEEDKRDIAQIEEDIFMKTEKRLYSVDGEVVEVEQEDLDLYWNSVTFDDEEKASPSALGLGLDTEIDPEIDILEQKPIEDLEKEDMEVEAMFHRMDREELKKARASGALGGAEDEDALWREVLELDVAPEDVMKAEEKPKRHTKKRSKKPTAAEDEIDLKAEDLFEESDPAVSAVKDELDELFDEDFGVEEPTSRLAEREAALARANEERKAEIAQERARRAAEAERQAAELVVDDDVEEEEEEEVEYEIVEEYISGDEEDGEEGVDYEVVYEYVEVTDDEADDNEEDDDDSGEREDARGEAEEEAASGSPVEAEEEAEEEVEEEGEEAVDYEVKTKSWSTMLTEKTADVEELEEISTYEQNEDELDVDLSDLDALEFDINELEEEEDDDDDDAYPKVMSSNTAVDWDTFLDDV